MQKAKQSSTDFGGNAEFAIDGITDGDFTRHPTSHTRESDNPWWEADLGTAQELNHVVFWNRTDSGLAERLNHFRVIVLDDKHQPVWETEVASPPNPTLDLDLTSARDIPLAGARAIHTIRPEPKDLPARLAIESSNDFRTGWGVSFRRSIDCTRRFFQRFATRLAGPGRSHLHIDAAFPSQPPIGRFPNLRNGRRRRSSAAILGIDRRCPGPRRLSSGRRTRSRGYSRNSNPVQHRRKRLKASASRALKK